MPIAYRSDEISEPFKWIFSDPQFLFPYEHPLRDYPFYLDIELTNRCNMSCIMCPRSSRMDRPIGNMPFETFKKIVDEVEGKGIALRFVGYGEPLLYPDLIEVLRYAHSKGITLFLSTNGLALTESLMRSLIEVGLDEMRFSMQGLDKEGYEEMRKSRFSTFKDKVFLASRIRGKDKSPLLTISTTIIEESPEDVKDYIGYWLAYVDKVIVDPTDLTWAKDYPEMRKYRPNFESEKVYSSCKDLVTKLPVNWEGDVKLCCWDINGKNLGSIKDRSLFEIWHDPLMEKMRDEVGRKLNHARYPFCENCYTITDRFEGYKQGTLGKNT